MFEDSFEQEFRSEVSDIIRKAKERAVENIDALRQSIARHNSYRDEGNRVRAGQGRITDLISSQPTNKKPLKPRPIKRRGGTDTRPNYTAIVFDKDLWESSRDIEKVSIFLAAISAQEEKFIADFLKYYRGLPAAVDAKERDKRQESAEAVSNFIFESTQNYNQRSVANLHFLFNRIFEVAPEELDAEFAEQIWEVGFGCRFLQKQKNNKSISTNVAIAAFEGAVTARFAQNPDLEPPSQKTISKHSNIIKNVLDLFKDQEISAHHPLISLNSGYIAKVLPDLDEQFLKKLWKYGQESKDVNVLTAILLFYKERFSNKNYLIEVAKLEDDEGLAKSLPARLFNIMSQDGAPLENLKKDLWQEIRDSGNRASKKRDFGLKIQKRIWFALALQEDLESRVPSVARSRQILDILSFCDIEDKNSLLYSHDPKTGRAMSPLAILGAAELVAQKAPIVAKYWNALNPKKQRQAWLEAVSKKRGDVISFILKLPQQNHQNFQDESGQISPAAQVVETLSKPIRTEALEKFFFSVLDQNSRQQIWFDAAKEGKLDVLNVINFIYKIQHQSVSANGLQSPVTWQDSDGKTALIKIFEQENISAKVATFLCAKGAKINSDAESKYIGKACDDFAIRCTERISKGDQLAAANLSELQTCVAGIKSRHASQNLKILENEIKRFASTTISYEIDDARKSLILGRIEKLPEIVQGATKQDFVDACKEVVTRCKRFGEFEFGRLPLFWTGCTSSYAGTFFNEYDVMPDKYKSVLACVLCGEEANLSAVAKNPLSQFRAIVDGFRGDNFDKIQEICKELEKQNKSPQQGLQPSQATALSASNAAVQTP